MHKDSRGLVWSRQGSRDRENAFPYLSINPCKAEIPECLFFFFPFCILPRALEEQQVPNGSPGKWVGEDKWYFCSSAATLLNVVPQQLKGIRQARTVWAVKPTCEESLSSSPDLSAILVWILVTSVDFFWRQYEFFVVRMYPCIHRATSNGRKSGTLQDRRIWSASCYPNMFRGATRKHHNLE